MSFVTYNDLYADDNGVYAFGPLATKIYGKYDAEAQTIDFNQSSQNPGFLGAVSIALVSSLQGNNPNCKKAIHNGVPTNTHVKLWAKENMPGGVAGTIKAIATEDDSHKTLCNLKKTLKMFHPGTAAYVTAGTVVFKNKATGKKESFASLEAAFASLGDAGIKSNVQYAAVKGGNVY